MTEKTLDKFYSAYQTASYEIANLAGNTQGNFTLCVRDILHKHIDPIFKEQGERENELKELLRSAHCIAARKGEGTAWEKFANSIRNLGIGSITARTYRILPNEEL